MSSDSSASAKENSEQDAEIQQEPQVPNEQPAVEAEADVEHVQENVDGSESTDSAIANDAPDLTASENAEPQLSPHESVATGGASLQDSLESLNSGVGSGTESQQGGVAAGVIRQLSQESSAFVGDSSTESKQSCSNGTELKLLGAVGGPSRQDLPGIAAAGSPGTSGSYETALAGDSSSRDSMDSGVTGGVSNSPSSQASSANPTGSWEGMAAPAPPLSAAGEDSRSGRRSPEVTLRETQQDDYEQRLRCCASACDFLTPCARYIRKSKIYRFLNRPMLLLLFLSAIGMGAAYHHHCPKKELLPVFFMLMGVAGTFLLAFSFASDLRPSLCPSINKWYFRAGILIATITFIWTFTEILAITYLSPPSFNPSDLKNYCDIVFYNYAFYINIVIIGIIVLAILLCASTINDNAHEYEQL